MNQPSSVPPTNSGQTELWSDPIVDEVRRVRELYASAFDFDLQALFKNLKAQEQQSDRRFVSYPARSLPTTELAVSQQVSPGLA
jgi:hypothetical protein